MSGHPLGDFVLSSEDFGSSLEGFMCRRPQVTFGIFGCLCLIFDIATHEVI